MQPPRSFLIGKRLLLVPALILCLAPRPAAVFAEENEVPQRLIAVKNWKGTVRVTERRNVTMSNEIGTLNSRINCTADYRVDLPYQGDESLHEWFIHREEGQPEAEGASGRIRFAGKSVSKAAPGTTTTAYSGGPEEQLYVDLLFYDEGYQLSLDAYAKTKVSEDFVSALPEIIPNDSNHYDESDHCIGGASMQPYPKSGFRLRGSVTYTDEDEDDPELRRIAQQAKGYLQAVGLLGKTVTTISWDLRPAENPDFEVEVEAEGYGQYLPKGTREPGRAGNQLIINARLKHKEGKGQGKPEGRFTFELQNTSREPGTAMNHPLAGGKDFDFKIEKTLNAGLEVSADGQSARSSGDDKKEKETLVLSSFDWGGTTELVIRAEIDGSEITGKLKGTNQETILIPKRKKGSRIAEHWLNSAPGAAGKKESADDDAKPEGDGRLGDGLTLYEEYRGFYSDMVYGTTPDDGHFRTRPDTKDVFIIDEIGRADSKAGIRAYAFNTELDVHEISPKNAAPSRVINFNGAGGAGHVNQHAIRMRWDPALSGTSIGGYVPQIATPKRGGELRLRSLPDRMVNLDGDERAGFARVVAHELLHTSCVDHHGNGDYGWVKWQTFLVDGEPTIIEYPVDENGDRIGTSGKKVRVFREEDGSRVSPDNFYMAAKVYAAKYQGEHSGVFECMMRYEVAEAYDPARRSLDRYWMVINEEEEGMILCDSKKGIPKYGDAPNGRCLRQVNVNDRYGTCRKG